MTKQLCILILILSFGLCSHGQSYIGFSGGHTNPLAYSNKKEYGYSEYKRDVNSKNGSYISFHFKDRLNKHFNLGLNASLSNLKINYTSHYSNYLKVYENQSYQSRKHIYNYNTYTLNFGLMFEKKLVKDFLFISLGPEISIPIYSYVKESIGSDPNYAFDISQGKNNNGSNSFRIFTALTFEKSLSKEFKLFANTQINYNLTNTYSGVKTLDFRLGLGVQLLIPEFSFGKLIKKISPGEPYTIKKK